MVKNLPANAGDTGDMGSIPTSGVPLEEGVAMHSSILAWEIPQRSLLGYSPRGHKRVGHD